MARFKVLTPDAQYADDGEVERAVAGPDFDWTIRRVQAGDSLPEGAVEGCDALVVWHEVTVDRAFIQRLKRCRIIVRAGVGFDHIDLAAAAEAGIPVCNTPDYGTGEVADHALAMALSLARGIPTYHEDLRRDPGGMFNSARYLGQKRLSGATFGVLGIGRIGTAAALRAKAFGMRVLAYDPYAPRGVERALGIERAESLEELLEASDILSLHAPLTPETREIIDAQALARMKPDAILVNTARGALVAMEPLVAALKADRLRAAGLDVFPQEPIPGDAPWYQPYLADEAWLRGRLLLTPHTAWLCTESRRDARAKAVETMAAFLSAGELRNCVNAMTTDRARPTQAA